MHALTHAPVLFCRQSQEQQEALQLLSRYLLKLGLQGLNLPPTVAAIVQGKRGGCRLICNKDAAPVADDCIVRHSASPTPSTIQSVAIFS